MRGGVDGVEVARVGHVDFDFGVDADPLVGGAVAGEGDGGEFAGGGAAAVGADEVFPGGG